MSLLCGLPEYLDAAQIAAIYDVGGAELQAMVEAKALHRRASGLYRTSELVKVLLRRKQNINQKENKQ